jgi:hypothetical protein
MPCRNRTLLVNGRGSRLDSNFSPPIGLLYLVAYLCAATEGAQVDVFDQKVSRLTHRAVADRAVQGGHGIVGLSAAIMVLFLSRERISGRRWALGEISDG